MKKTLLVVLLALTMVFAFASMAMADGPALTVDGDDYAVAAKTDFVEISFKATGLTAGETYFVQAGSEKGAEVTVAESATTADLKLKFKPAEGWQHTGENESGSFDLMKKGTPDEKVATAVGPKVKVGSDKAELDVKKASTETAYVNIEKSTDGKTFTVYTDAASVKLALTASADATIDKGATLTLSADTTVKVSAQNGTEVT
ncbi:MAG: hypothetical protein Q4B50_07510, partial [Bacillota bacterium]|nr:hypothetical protein [Bacillota bacterium]